MKIRRFSLKLLSLALSALLLLSALPVGAFASAEQGLSLEFSEEDGVLTAALYINDLIGFRSSDITVEYDKDRLSYEYTDASADAANVNNTLRNSFSSLDNGETEGEIRYSFYFQEELWTAEEFAADAKKGKTVTVDSTHFCAGLFTFTVTDDSTEPMEFRVTGVVRTEKVIKVDETFSYGEELPGEDGLLKLTMGEVKNGVLPVYLILQDLEGFRSADLVIGYDDDLLTYLYADGSDDITNVNDTRTNSFSAQDNETAPGEIKYSFYFQENLWTAEEFAADAKPGKTVVVHSDEFNAGAFLFELKDPNKKAELTFTLRGGYRVPQELTAEQSVTFTYEPEDEPVLPPDPPAADGKIILSFGQETDGILPVYLYLCDMVGMSSADLTVKYDPDVMTYQYADESDDMKAVGRTLNNSFAAQDNEINPGEIKYSFYFQEKLWSPEEFAANAKPGKTVSIDSDFFCAGVFLFELSEDPDYPIEISLAGSYRSPDDLLSVEHTAYYEPALPDTGGSVSVIWTETAETVSAYLYLNNLVGFETGDIELRYDPEDFTYLYAENSADIDAVNDTVSNAFMYQDNDKGDGVIKYSFLFEEALWSAERFAADAKPGKTVSIDSSSFCAGVFVFEKKNAESSLLTVSGSGTVNGYPIALSCTSEYTRSFHVHSFEVTQIINEAANEIVYTCSVCGETYKGCDEDRIAEPIKGSKAREACNNYITVMPGAQLSDLLETFGEDICILDKNGDPAVTLSGGCTVILPDGRTSTVLIKGDFDGNNVIEPADARAALRIAVKLDADSFRNRLIGNVTADDKDSIEPADARAILRAAVSLEPASGLFI